MIKVETEKNLGSANRLIWILSKELYVMREGRWLWAWVSLVLSLALCVSLYFNFR